MIRENQIGRKILIFYQNKAVVLTIRADWSPTARM